MKKHLILSLSMVGAVASMQAMNDNNNEQLTRGDDAYGQTFFSIRPEFETCSPEYQSGWRDRAKARCDGRAGAFQFVPLGGQSTKSKDLMRYFSPTPVDQLVVDSNPAAVQGVTQLGLERNINPVFFGIQVTAAGGGNGRYQSVLQFRPRRTVGGVGITYRQYFGRDCDCDEKQWWFELSAPILHVRNKMRLEETAPNLNGGTLVAGSAPNMIVALAGVMPVLGATAADGLSTMQFGLMRNANQDDNFNGVVGNNDNNRKGYTRTGSDIELKFGRDYYTSECCHFDGYVGLHIPASNKPKGRFVFEAVPGFNQHFGFMLGGSSGTEIWRNCDRSLSWEAATNVRYWIRNTQTRSFDLKDRPWSRYMFITDNANPAAPVIVPGINVLTQKLRVHPRFSFDTNVALVYNNDCGFNAELGWNFWARQGERVSLRNQENGNRNDNNVTLPFVAGRYFVTALTGANGLDVTETNLLSNIANNNQPANLALDEALALDVTDLNLLSAAAPAALSNTVYGYVGYNWDDRCYPLFVGLGGSYEISKKNTALNRWLVWGKFGVSI